MSATGMRQQKIDLIRRRETLDHLLDHVPRLEVIRGQARIRDKLPAPVDEYGIPRVDMMIQGLLGELATKTYVWTGKFDLHHMATPKADYNVVPDNVGKAFRSLPALKVELPRQMHNLSHELFLTPRHPPHQAIMRQAVLENEQLKTLHTMLGETLDEEHMRVCIDNVLEDMVDPYVAIMPSREALASLELNDLRRTVDALIRVRRYSKKEFIHPAIRPRPALRHLVA